jgi:arsenite methyltransferase
MTARQTSEAIRDDVRQHYGEVARTGGACGCGPGCCASVAGASEKVGYSTEALASLPEGADMGLGCGTPLAFAEIQSGETVVDLGSGGGIDCLLAAKQVGAGGRVIGIDMTPAMISKARANAERAGVQNVEFRLGEIERLPVADRSADVIVSNCVINLSPEKSAVFRDAYRVLRAGGRLAISDIVASAPLPESIRQDPQALAGCVAGAPAVDELRAHLVEAGFTEVSIEIDEKSRSFIRDWMPESGVEGYVASAAIRAKKPTGEACCGTAPSASCC